MTVPHGVRVGAVLEQQVRDFARTPAPRCLVQGRDRVDGLPARVPFHGLFGIGAVLKQKANHLDVVEIERPGQRIGTASCDPVLHQQPEPVQMAKLGGVIETLVVVRLRAVREQPFRQSQVISMAERAIERRKHMV